MSINYRGQSFVSFQEYIEQQPIQEEWGTDSSPYAHPIDAWILHALNATPVKAVMNNTIDALVSLQFGYDLANGISIDQKTFPDLFKVLSHCCRTLRISMPHAVASNSPGYFNAYTAGTDEYTFINISSSLCQLFTQGEAYFVIGHECGHVAAGHMLYHTLASVITDATTIRLGLVGEILRSTAGIPLLAWSRRSEITADRAGLLCCGDLGTAERALLRSVIGVGDAERVDIENYLRRFRGVEEFHELAIRLGGLFASHPLIPKRIKALRLFADSEPYYSLTGKSRPVGRVLLSQEELNRQIDYVVRP